MFYLPIVAVSQFCHFLPKKSAAADYWVAPSPWSWSGDRQNKAAHENLGLREGGVFAIGRKQQNSMFQKKKKKIRSHGLVGIFHKSLTLNSVVFTIVFIFILLLFGVNV